MPETTASAGATPAAADATSTQTTPVSPATDSTAAPPPPATGDPDALGDAGKRALENERTARKAAETAAKTANDELEKLRSANQTDSEKALAAARKEGSTEAAAKYANQIRRSEVKAALTAAGINGALLDLAVKADEFESLKVSDDGEVQGIAEALTAFKARLPDAFTKPVTPGSADGGTRGKTRLTKEEVARISADPVEYDKRRDEIMDWMATSPK